MKHSSQTTSLSILACQQRT